MARKAKRKSSASASPSSSVPSRKLVLCSKTSKEMKRSLRQTISRKKPKAKQKIDAKKPKKPPTAFFYFFPLSFLREDFRKEFQEQNPDVKSMRDIGKACGEKWKTMTYEEKVQYYDIATQKRAEFDMAMAEYNKKMENGEFEETDEESDFDE
ncbi:hypothetical protein PIB30_043933 [Stylosanthes scabra]|uniref:HMG box domain-containing protein n=1 Tax=Stylosanthes scabra TaxID=79078 RepID=A0ABU6XEH3_9FABA|nr:hypothetical protein [Stylosanthes scabra]